MPCVIAIVLAFLVGLAFLFFRRIRLIGVLLTVAAICAAGYAVALDRRYQRSFPLIVAGDSEQHVRTLLGRPDSITDGTKAEYGLPRSASEVRSDVAQEYWYYCVYAPHVWAVSFDKDRKVVRTYEL
ncbi:MAG: hypothetical protein ABIV39_19370, partial [Verrucomicrobiota bacterium]